MKARVSESPLIKELLCETTPEEMERIDKEMSKQQTAVEWFFSELERMQYFIGNDMLESYKQAKEMEKEQMMKTWTKAIDQTQERAWNVIRAYDDFDDYYNETYGGTNE